MMLLWLYLAAVSLALFALMGIDKAAAKNRCRRIPERSLLALAVLPRRHRRHARLPPQNQKARLRPRLPRDPDLPDRRGDLNRLSGIKKRNTPSPFSGLGVFFSYFTPRSGRCPAGGG